VLLLFITDVVWFMSGGAEVNQNVPLTLFDKFHRNVNLLKFQKPIQLLVSRRWVTDSASY